MSPPPFVPSLASVTSGCEHETIYQANFNARCVGSQGPMRPATFTRHDESIQQRTYTTYTNKHEPYGIRKKNNDGS